MNIDGKPFRTIWYNEADRNVKIIDQTQLPHHLKIATLNSLDDVCHAILEMLVRGAPLIGATAAYGIAIACRENATDDALDMAAMRLLATRPTAVNLRWAVKRICTLLKTYPLEQREKTAFNFAQELCDEDSDVCSRIGDAGVTLIESLYEKKNTTINILTHCNAGWLATVDWGTAIAPIYKAFNKGIPIHVWVDETRPRNQGAFLTAWELNQHGVPHTIIPDNTGGHLMQHGLVDMCIVGTDRTTAHGDVCNKIGTYLKALAAFDNNIPFYTASPTSSIDWDIYDGLKEIPIEERHHSEVSHISGLSINNTIEKIKLIPQDSKVANFGFDVTPARLVTALITEFGIYPATASGLSQLKKHLPL